MSLGGSDDRGIGRLNRQLSGKKFMDSGDNMKAAKETYGGFTFLLKWGAITAAVATIVVIALIA